MAVDAMDVANYLIQKGVEVNNPLSSTKLQKLLYYAQGYWMALHDGESLIERDFKKLPHGPVCVYVLRQFKKHSGPIRNPLDKSFVDNLPSSVKEHLDKIWRTFGKYSATELSDRSHREQPWLQTPDYETIEPWLLYEYFHAVWQETLKRRAASGSGTKVGASKASASAV